MSKCVNCCREVHDGFNYCPTCGFMNVEFFPDDRVVFSTTNDDETDGEMISGEEAICWIETAIKNLGATPVFENDHLKGYEYPDGRKHEFRTV